MSKISCLSRCKCLRLQKTCFQRDLEGRQGSSCRPGSGALHEAVASVPHSGCGRKCFHIYLPEPGDDMCDVCHHAETGLQIPCSGFLNLAEIHTYANVKTVGPQVSLVSHMTQPGCLGPHSPVAPPQTKQERPALSSGQVGSFFFFFFFKCWALDS